MGAPESAARPVSADLDSILGQQLRVLDDGFIRVVDYLGTDASIVQAARVSYGAGTRKVSDDRALIRYLMRHRHTTPFEMCELKLHVRVPMDTWRQWIRHRMASVNEYSTRYSVAIDAAQRTAADQWRTQSSANRQGSDDFLDAADGAGLSSAEGELIQHAHQVYAARLEAGVAREQARKDLPLSTFTEAYWKIDLHNLLHFLALRMDAHAQAEIRGYATVIGQQVVRRWCPLAWEAFCDYRLQALSLTRVEVEVLGALNRGDTPAAVAAATEAGWLKKSKSGGLIRSRERDEAGEKLARLGLSAPW